MQLRVTQSGRGSYEAPTGHVHKAKVPANCSWASVTLSSTVTAHGDKARKVTGREALPESQQSGSTVEIKVTVPWVE